MLVVFSILDIGTDRADGWTDPTEGFYWESDDKEVEDIDKKWCGEGSYG